METKEDEVWNEVEMLAEFTKQFLVLGQGHLLEALTINPTLDFSHKLMKRLALNVTFGVSVVTNVLHECMDQVDKINRNNLKLAVINSIRSSSKQVYREEFERILVQSAIEIFCSFQPQLKFVFQKTGHHDDGNKNNDDEDDNHSPSNQQRRLQALKILADHASQMCIHRLTNARSVKFVHRNVLENQGQRQGQHKYRAEVIEKGEEEGELVLEWSENSKLVLSKSNFFQWPIVAVSSGGPSSSLNDSDGDGGKIVLIGKADLKRFQDGGHRWSWMLRNPMDFECNSETKKLEGDLIQIPIDSLDDAALWLPFEWKDRREMVDDLHWKVRKMVDKEAMHNVYVKIGERVIYANESFLKALEQILMELLEDMEIGFKLELTQQAEIAQKIQQEVQKLLERLDGPEMAIRSKRTNFHIQNPIGSFAGRKEFLSKVHAHFQKKVENHHDNQLNSHVVITGQGGIGKSGAARKYIQDYGSNYHHVIWIDAESTESMIQDFRSLAEQKLKIPLKTGQSENRWSVWEGEKILAKFSLQMEKSKSHGNQKGPWSKFRDPSAAIDGWRSMDEILKEIYEILCQHPALFIFDNASTLTDDDYSTSSNHGGISNFLPHQFSTPRLIPPKMLITSRNTAVWPPTEFENMVLDPLSKDESIELIVNRLGLNPESTNERKVAGDLADLIDGLPLSLQVAACSIRKNAKLNFLEPLQLIPQYIGEYNSKLRSPDFAPFLKIENITPSSTTIYLTLLLTLEKIDPICLSIIKYAAFLSPDEIPKECLLSLFPLAQGNLVEDGFFSLKEFSLVKTSMYSIHVHRKVQEVVLEKLRRDKMDQELLQEILTHLTQFISSKNPATYDLYRATLTNALKVIDHLWATSSTSSPFDWATSSSPLALERRTSTLAPLTSERRPSASSAHSPLERRISTPSAHQPVERRTSLAPATIERRHSPHTLAAPLMSSSPASPLATNRMATEAQEFIQFIGERLLDLGWHSKALQLYTSLFDLSCQQFGENDPKTLQLEFQLAKCHLVSANHKKALDLFNTVYDSQRRILGDRHPDVLKTLCEIAQLKASRGHDPADALRLLDELHDIQKQVLYALHPETLSVLHDKAIALQKLKRFDESMSIFNEVVQAKIEIFGPNSPKVIQTESDLAAMLAAKEETAGGGGSEALKLLHILLGKKKEIYGDHDNHPEILKTMWEIVRVLQTRGEFEEALEIAKEVYESKKKIWGDSDRRTISSLEDVGWLLFEQKKFGQSYSLCENVLVKRKNLLGPFHPDVLTTMCNMGRCKFLEKEYLEAFNLYKSVHEIFKELEQGHEEGSQSLMTMVAMARSLSAQVKFEDALELYNICMMSRKKFVGQNHPETLLICSEMAGIYEEQKMFERALDLNFQIFEQQLEIWGQDGQETLLTAVGIARLYLNLDKFEDTLEFLGPMTPHFEKFVQNLNNNNTKTAGADETEFEIKMEAEIGLGIILMMQEKYQNALTLFGKIWEEEKTILGPTHKKTLTDQWLIYTVHRVQGTYAKALPVLDAIHKIQVDTLGPDHHDSLFTAVKIAHLHHLKDERQHKALEMYQAVTKKIGEVFGEEHPTVMEAEETVATIFEKLNRYEEALKMCRRVYDKRVKILGECHPDTLKILFLKAIIFVSQKKFDEALAVLQRAYEVQVDGLGREHPESVSTKEKIEAVQEYLNDKKKKGCGCSIV